VVQVEVRQLVEASERQQTRKAADQKLKAAVTRLKEFHKKLATIQILDPACGTGNFLYVSLDILKRLENEVVTRLAELGESALLELEGVRVTPAQFHGIEIKPWAKEIAELVLWIGYLQWQARASGKKLNATFEEPVLRDYGNIECRDAVLASDGEPQLLRDANGKPVTRWDGETMMKHPSTGEPVPDERFTMLAYTYANPRAATWPTVDFIVGNPPFIGNKRMRSILGDGYVDALRGAHGSVPESADFVMYWWNQAALQLRRGSARRFGLITTNSIGQSQGRRLIESQMSERPALRVVFAVPDHPWVDTKTGAAVRIAMTVADLQDAPGRLCTVTGEGATCGDEVAVELSERQGRINADLSTGSDASAAQPLRANQGLSFMGVTLVGEGFRLDREDLARLAIDPTNLPSAVRPYRSGRELTQKAVERWVIDLFGLDEAAARREFPGLYQWLYDRVRPDRLAKAGNNKDAAAYAAKWWLFAKPRPDMRRALAGSKRFIATLETSKHRVFTFLDGATLADHSLYAIALDDAFALGVLSSRVHLLWALSAGSRLGVGNDPRYRNGLCFEPFPFPTTDAASIASVRDLAEELDAHRKRQQTRYADLTITGMYNVLDKLRRGESLTDTEKAVHEQGLLSILAKLHDDLDAAVFAAYGWPGGLTDEQVIDRVVILNAERSEDERKGLVRWLRPEFQNAAAAKPMTQVALMPDAEELAVPVTSTATPWPKKLPEQIAGLRDLVLRSSSTWTAQQAASAFKGAKPHDVELVLESLAALGLLVSWSSGVERQWKAARA